MPCGCVMLWSSTRSRLFLIGAGLLFLGEWRLALATRGERVRASQSQPPGGAGMPTAPRGACQQTPTANVSFAPCLSTFRDHSRELKVDN